jgi:hypothetical protein
MHRPPPDSGHWSIAAMLPPEPPSFFSAMLEWWYRLTALSEPSDDTFAQREKVRKSRFLSALIFGCICIFLFFIPGCLIVPNHFILFADITMLLICVAAIFANRKQKVSVAGFLLTGAFELALTMVIFTTLPLDETSIQQYELFVIGECLAVSLLTPASVFIVMIYNVVIITISLLYQPHTAIFAHDLHTQLIAVWSRPVSIQFLVALVTYLWVRSETRASVRADRLEWIVNLEHKVAHQREEAEREQKRWQEGMERLARCYAEMINAHDFSRPLSMAEFPAEFRPFIMMFNNRRIDLGQLYLVEGELSHLKQAIIESEKKARLGQLDLNVRTGTLLDLLFASLNKS